MLPPLLGQNFGYAWSKSNRTKHLSKENKFQGEENEVLVDFAKKYSEENKVDYLIFGHRHIELNLSLPSGSQMLILGDFVKLFTYAAFDGEALWMESFEA